MDPNATMRAWMDAPSRETNANLNEWLARGGFSPVVEVAPHTDLFMRGERWGSVLKVGDKFATIKGHRSARTFRVSRDAIARVVGESVPQ